MYKLVISDDEGKTTVVPLVRSEISIGRKEGNTIRLTERNVSRRHARLHKSDGYFFVEDLGSYNGVRLNGDRIEGEERVRNGDKVAIGDYVLTFESDEPEPPIPDPPSDAAASGASGPPAVPPGAATPVTDDSLDVDVLGLDGVEAPEIPARLVLLSAPAPGAEFAIHGGPMKIGRSDALPIWVNHKSVSREHAEVELDGDIIRIRDLGSANGVRVNGRDMPRGEIVSGDVVELGKVRFRVVSKGEVYVYDSDAAEAEALATLERSGMMPLIVALVILAVALAIGLSIALSGDDEMSALVGDGPEGASGGALSAPEEAEVPVDPAEAAASLARCESALESHQWADAQAEADRAIVLDATNASARHCRDAARAQLAAESLFETGKRALEANDYDAAFGAFRSLPTYSPRLNEPEVERARRGYVDRHLQLARRAIRSDATEAARHAGAVLEAPGLSSRQAGEAERILARARRGGATIPEPGGAAAGATASPPQPTVVQAPAAVERGLDAARQCLRRGDSACVIRALEGGHADSPAALALLIETYRSTGDGAASQREMRSFVQRYPSDRRADRYRGELGGGGN